MTQIWLTWSSRMSFSFFVLSDYNIMEVFIPDRSIGFVLYDNLQPSKSE